MKFNGNPGWKYSNLALFFSGIILGLPVQAEMSDHAQQLLKKFEQAQTPEQMQDFMAQKPVKREIQTNQQGQEIRQIQVIGQDEGAFVQQEDYTLDNLFVEKRDSFKIQYQNYEKEVTLEDGSKKTVQVQQLIDTEQGKAPIASNDRVESLVDLPHGKRIIRSLKGLEDAGLRSAQLPDEKMGWSDDYWAIYSGGLSKRYAETQRLAQKAYGWNAGGFPNSEDWAKNYRYVRKLFPLLTSFSFSNARNKAHAINTLSPAEKYALLTGDKRLTMVKQKWEKGRGYYNHYGKVETWMGECHGWAAAAYKFPRPTKAVVVKAADGKTEITFYPSDIKALATYYWAQVRTPTYFLGGRCNAKDPKTDENGRVLSQACFDNNPGTVLLALTNQIGQKKESLIMDATYDYEVWNQPISSYSYSYYNPQTRRHVRNLSDAIVAKKDFTRDKFKRHRKRRGSSNYYTHVAGISMEVTYVVETDPSHDQNDSLSEDATRTVTYLFDVEIDARNGAPEKSPIVGGEKYTRGMPDFLWDPAVNRAETEASRELDLQLKNRRIQDWTRPNQGFPKAWKEYVQGELDDGAEAPLLQTIERLIAFSRG